MNGITNQIYSNWDNSNQTQKEDLLKQLASSTDTISDLALFRFLQNKNISPSGDFFVNKTGWIWQTKTDTALAKIFENHRGKNIEKFMKDEAQEYQIIKDYNDIWKSNVEKQNFLGNESILRELIDSSLSPQQLYQFMVDNKIRPNGGWFIYQGETTQLARFFQAKRGISIDEFFKKNGILDKDNAWSKLPEELQLKILAEAAGAQQKKGQDVSNLKLVSKDFKKIVEDHTITTLSDKERKLLVDKNLDTYIELCQKNRGAGSQANSDTISFCLNEKFEIMDPESISSPALIFITGSRTGRGEVSGLIKEKDEIKELSNFSLKIAKDDSGVKPLQEKDLNPLTKIVLKDLLYAIDQLAEQNKSKLDVRVHIKHISYAIGALEKIDKPEIKLSRNQ